MNDAERDSLLLKMDVKINYMLETDAKIKVVLFDTDGNKGLCSRVDEICQDIRRQRNHIFRLWLAVVILGSSVGGGAYGVIQLLLD